MPLTAYALNFQLWMKKELHRLGLTDHDVYLSSSILGGYVSVGSQLSYVNMDGVKQEKNPTP